jgi:hypothetical protein
VRIHSHRGAWIPVPSETADAPDASDYIFKKYIKMGMPARYEDNRWIAHTDNIDEFFRQYTKVSMRKMMETIPEN